MSNLPQEITLRQYQADGVTTTFVYPFLLLLDSDLSVYVTLAGNTPNPTNDIKVLGVDYTVTNVGNQNGGNVVFTIAPPLGAIVTLDRTMAISIDTNFALAQNFNGANLDAAFERVTLFCQQLNTILAQKTLQYIVNSYLPNVNSNQIPTLANGQVWSGLNGAIVATNIETNPNISLLRSQLASAAPLGEGALLVGYYDTINRSQTTVGNYLDYKDVYGIDSGVADAMVLTIPTSNFSYATGQTVHIVVGNTNITTTPTLNVNGKGAIVIKRNPSSSAQPGDLAAGTIADLLYDGTANRFYIINLFIPQVSPLAPTMQQFNISGSSGTYITPSGVVYIDVYGVAGGGGAGGARGGGSSCAVSGGGGGGGYFFKRIVSPLASYAYAIGSGGAGGSDIANGSNGTATTFGTSFLIANGGLGSIGCINGTLNYSPGGSGGTATGGDINIQGNAGTSGHATYVLASNTAGVAGNGGSSYLGGSVVGPGIGLSTFANGNNGLNYGGGGSGCVTSNSSTVTGGFGAGAILIVREYYA